MNSIEKRIRSVVREFCMKYFHYSFLNFEYKRMFGCNIDWDNPKNLNEKILWLARYTDTSMWTKLADKYAVREYIESKGYKEILVPLLGKWDNASDIDFEKLPNSFILKCNHDSGSYHKVQKDKGYDRKFIIKDLNNHLRCNFGLGAERHYSEIKPCVIAEMFLKQDDLDFTNTLVDYKVWCFDGKPYSIWACYDRTHNGTYVNSFDLNWNIHTEHSVFTDYYRDGKGKVPRPKSLDKMLKVASDLSKGFPEVRIDFYDIKGKLYFGEMTFTSASGLMNFYTKDYLLELGNQVVLPPKTVCNK